MMHPDFVDLLAYVPALHGQAQYASPDNFTGEIVTGYGAPRIWGTRALAQALQSASVLARQEGHSLFLFDAYRPCRAVAHFMRWVSRPEDGRTKARFYPRLAKSDLVPQGYIAARSGHSRGSTVDLTLLDERTHLPLDMGGSFDLMDPSSHHESPGISLPASHNRLLLRRLMELSGFRAYEGEWWHYTLENEPFPDTYFDFPIVP